MTPPPSTPPQTHPVPPVSVPPPRPSDHNRQWGRDINIMFSHSLSEHLLSRQPPAPAPPRIPRSAVRGHHAFQADADAR